jgi:hypothetical protein
LDIPYESYRGAVTSAIGYITEVVKITAAALSKTMN